MGFGGIPFGWGLRGRCPSLIPCPSLNTAQKTSHLGVIFVNFVREARMKRCHYNLPVRQIKQLETLREQMGLTSAELIRRAIDLLISEYAEKPYLTGESEAVS